MGALALDLAGKVTNPTAQQVLLKDTRYRQPLMRNPWLTDEAFAQLYPNRKTKVADAKTLLARRLTDVQFDHVIGFESRSSVLERMFHDGLLSSRRMFAYLRSAGSSTKVVDSLIDRCNLAIPTEWVREAGQKLGGQARLEAWLREPDSYTDTQIAEELENYSQWGAKWASLRLQLVLATRPALIGAAARSEHLPVRSAAAGCRHLTELDDQLATLGITALDQHGQVKDLEDIAFLIVALTHNPVVGNDVVQVCDTLLRRLRDPEKVDGATQRLARHPHPVVEPFEEVRSPEQLGWLVSRCLPWGSKPGRPADLRALLDNPNIGYPELTTITRRLRDAERYPAPDILVKINTLRGKFEELRDAEPLEVPTDLWAFPSADQPPEQVNGSADLYPKSAPTTPDILRYSPHAVRLLERELGDNPLGWQVVFDTADAFTGSLHDLITFANVTTATP